MKQMLKAGVHFGHKKSKYHPSTKPFIHSVRHNVHIFDLEKTKKQLEQARDVIQDIADKGEQVLFVGTKKQVAPLIEQIAKDLEMPYVNNRWLGGTFTNFEVIRKQVEKLQDLESKFEQGEMSKYTKKEQHEFRKEIERLDKLVGGIRSMGKLPSAIFVIGADKDKLAIKEANMVNVPVIALVDSNIDLNDINYPIPANDDAIQSIKLILKFINYVSEKKQDKEKKEK